MYVYKVNITDTQLIYFIDLNRLKLINLIKGAKNEIY